MFKNRSIQVKYVKTPRENSETTSEPTPSVDYVQIARETAESVGKYVVVGVATYVAVDTLRQVLVKLTPTN